MTTDCYPVVALHAALSSDSGQVPAPSICHPCRPKALNNEPYLFEGWGPPRPLTANSTPCRFFLASLKSAMIKGCREPPYPSILTDATMEKLALAKFVAQESKCEVRTQGGGGVPETPALALESGGTKRRL